MPTVEKPSFADLATAALVFFLLLFAPAQDARTEIIASSGKTSNGSTTWLLTYIARRPWVQFQGDSMTIQSSSGPLPCVFAASECDNFGELQVLRFHSKAAALAWIKDNEVARDTATLHEVVRTTTLTRVPLKKTVVKAVEEIQGYGVEERP